MVAAYQLREAMQGKARKRVIDLGSDLPFRQVPKIVRDGFERLLGRGDQGIRDHYRPRNRLDQCRDGNLMMIPHCYGWARRPI